MQLAIVECICQAIANNSRATLIEEELRSFGSPKASLKGSTQSVFTLSTPFCVDEITKGCRDYLHHNIRYLLYATHLDLNTTVHLPVSVSQKFSDLRDQFGISEINRQYILYTSRGQPP